MIENLDQFVFEGVEIDFGGRNAVRKVFADVKGCSDACFSLLDMIFGEINW